MTKREKMHACVLYNPNDETIMAERSGANPRRYP